MKTKEWHAHGSAWAWFPGKRGIVLFVQNMSDDKEILCPWPLTQRSNNSSAPAREPTHLLLRRSRFSGSLCRPGLFRGGT